MAKKKFYAVATGRTTGIFDDWATAESQVKGFAGAKYKSFPTKEQALAWLEDPVWEKKAAKDKTKTVAKEVAVNEGDIVIHTDGGSINNPGPGGYGIVMEKDGEQFEYSGGFRHTTNNRMEMMAAIVALQKVRTSRDRIHLFSDSSYLVNGIEKGWAKKWQKNGWKKSDGDKALNSDLWQSLLGLLAQLQVSFHWVKGHAGHAQNERCDQLAVEAARSNPEAVDEEYELQEESK